MFGIVTIGSVESSKVEAAKARILAIVDPPKAELGAVYNGRVVNITKFGAFVNIMPGRDGLVHISKLGRGKRINAVEDVLQLGDAIEVRVDDIDDKGKVSLSPVGDGPEPTVGTGTTPAPAAVGVVEGDGESFSDSPVVAVSFEDSFDEEIRSVVGDLGPAGTPAAAGSGSGGGDDRRGGDRNRGGRRRHR